LRGKERLDQGRDSDSRGDDNFVIQVREFHEGEKRKEVGSVGLTEKGNSFERRGKVGGGKRSE